MLSPKQTRLLARISKNKEVRGSKPNKDLDYLMLCGYIEAITCDKPDDFFSQPYITEKGKAKLSIELSGKRRHSITTVIAILGLIGGWKEEFLSLLQTVIELLKDVF